MIASPLPDLVGRQRECAALDDLLAGLRDGGSRALVVRGEAGIGKSVLLEYVAARASRVRVTWARGVEADMELPYASLHQVCAPFMDGVEELPQPQRDALRVAFGTAVGDPPDRFLVGLAVLTLLTRASETRPVLVLVDDAQWLDQVSLQTLEFVARRLLAEPVAMAFAVRDPEGRSALAGLPALQLSGLDAAAAGELLESAVGGRLEERVRDRFVAETHGNPLALLEFSRGRSAAELAYGVDASSAPVVQGPVASRVERDFAGRLGALPAATRTLLLIAAAEPVGDVRLLTRAAASLGITPDAAPAKAAGLIEFGEPVRFRHPLVRSAVYHGADPEERRAVHRALAEATDPLLDPDRRAWHAAQAADGPDEEVAAGLEQAADRARQRGGIAAEAVLLERAVEVTPDPWPRGRRALAAAEAHFSAAAPERATELAAVADLYPLSVLDRARLARLRARILFARSRSDEAAPLLLNAAAQFTAAGSPLARETYLEAISATIFAGRVHGPTGARAAATAARASGAPSSGSKAADALLDGVAALLADGSQTGVPALREALDLLEHEELRTREATVRWLLLAPVALEAFIHWAWDLQAWDTLSSRAVRLARDIGALGTLPPALIYAGGVHIHYGDFAEADRMIDEADAIAAATGHAPHKYATLVLAAWRGEADVAAGIIEEARERAVQRGEVSLLGAMGYIQGVLFNGLARYEEAMEAARTGIEHDGFNFTGLSLVEHVEAATRCGELDQARASSARLTELTRAADSGWARGASARSEALLADGEAADRLYRTAIEEFGRGGVVVEVARTHLLYGEWLRRARHRAQAREHLRTAHDMFDAMPAHAFAERARRELIATGEQVTARETTPANALTPQESQVAALAADGMTNARIGAELFISPHTVEWHLRKVYVKLGISSRRALPGVLEGARAR
ncbi:MULTISPECIES: LuxR family transcriptional regulator [unclassified Streptomyces]|uniref:helix-turn-helix transcriptional regulator n=1 Tax=unclassified Streptomyces TaxID=2593676 RepID=UPI0007470C17|nr:MULTISPECIES: LuxR family transcriptional regulator [unclassified Streptomyces]KUL72313.1 LuxR family transcriptional regulator [Streptomyces sp. NRRL WC-3604]KUL73080.1 LuxR family transcriptional regulator [Streptomyces sp. NRRL WC-3605]